MTASPDRSARPDPTHLGLVPTAPTGAPRGDAAPVDGCSSGDRRVPDEARVLGMDVVPAPLARFDRAGNPVTANPAWRTLLGCPAASDAAWTVAWSFALENDAVAHPTWRFGVGGRDPFSVSFRIGTVAGTRSVRVHAEPDPGPLGGWIATALDVSAEAELRAALAASEERTRSLERREQAAADLARRDPLTGLCNRRFLTDELRRRLADGEPTALLFIDLDDFKGVNDALGHAAGDEVLTVLARRLRAGLRSTDLAARYAGDEFVVLCPPWSARAVAERLVHVLAVPVRLPDGTIVEVGASIGVTTTGESTPALALERADRAMYQAKRQGKGRIAVVER